MNIMPVSVSEVLTYLGIDYSDEMIETNLKRLIKTADYYLKGSIGVDYPTSDPRTKELALIIISDLYDNRGLSCAVSNTTRKIVDDLSMQLKMELRRESNDENI